MKINDLVKELGYLVKEQGNIECQLQDCPAAGVAPEANERIFVVCEEYEDGWRVNIRAWPY